MRFDEPLNPQLQHRSSNINTQHTSVCDSNNIKADRAYRYHICVRKRETFAELQEDAVEKNGAY